MEVVEGLSRFPGGGQASGLLRWRFLNNKQASAQNGWRSHKAEVAAPNGFDGLGAEHDRKQRFRKGVGGHGGWRLSSQPSIRH